MMRWLVPIALLLAGCQPQRAPEPTQALARCEAAALPQLRTGLPQVRAVALGPLAATTVETRPSGAVGTVLRGGGRADGGAPGDLRFVCLIDRFGEVMLVDVAPAGPAMVDAGCAGAPACLRQRLTEAEALLARAEAAAIGAAGDSPDDPVAASIGAWRVYRDAECRRSNGGDACRLARTHARILELRLH